MALKVTFKRGLKGGNKSGHLDRLNREWDDSAKRVRAYLFKSLGQRDGDLIWMDGQRIHNLEERMMFYSQAIIEVEQHIYKDSTPYVNNLKNLAIYKYKPVDVKEFLCSPAYLNKEKEIYPVVLEAAEEICSGPYVEAVISGGIGSGKTSLALIVTAYQLYLLSCMRNPHKLYGQEASSEIIIIFQSITKELATQLDYSRFRSMIESSEYFKLHYPFDKSLKSKLAFPNRIEVRPVSGSDTAAIGQNVIGGCFPPTQKYLDSDGHSYSFGSMLGKPIKALTLNKNGRILLSRGTRVVKTGTKSLVRMFLANGDTIDCTPDQRFKDGDNEWVKAEDSVGVLLRFTPYTLMRHQGFCPIGFVKCERVEELSGEVEVYDIENVGGTHIFFAETKAKTGFLQSHQCIDELNYMAVIEKSKSSVDKGTYDQAVAVYNSIARRRKSRFLEDGKMPGVLCLVSSKKYPGQFTDTKMEEAKTDPTIYVYDKRMWEVKPWAFTQGWFTVFVGDLSRKPRILDQDEEVSDEDRTEVISVPLEFKKDFDKDIINALREIAGVSTLARHPFFIEVDKVHAAFDNKAHTIFSQSPVDFVQTQLRLYKKAFYKPELPRFVHMDLAVTGDSAGLVVGTVIGFKNVSGDTSDPAYMPVFWIDGTLEITPPKNSEILFSKVRQVIFALRDMGLNIRWMTADQYQSQDSQQILRQKGIVTGRQSMDEVPSPSSAARGKGQPYDYLKNAIYEGRLTIPPHPHLQKELLMLEKDTKTGKIDHPPLGSKDVADSLAGIVYGLTMRREIWAMYGIPLVQVPSNIQAAGENLKSKEDMPEFQEGFEDENLRSARERREA